MSPTSKLETLKLLHTATTSNLQEEKLTVPDDIGDVLDDFVVDDEIIEISKHPE